MPRPVRRRLAGVAAGVALVAAAVGVGLVLQGTGDRPVPAVAAPAPPGQAIVAAPTLAAGPRATSAPACTQRVRPFVPSAFGVAHVGTSVPVVAVPKDAQGVPGTPPLTSTGKAELAWAPDRLPGVRHGNVLLNAHTWPDGSALGNRLLAGLHRGDTIVARGAGGIRLCYRVTERVEVPASTGLARYYATTGPPRLAIVVCSGTRLGPGDWTNRTIWFASPS